MFENMIKDLGIGAQDAVGPDRIRIAKTPDGIYLLVKFRDNREVVIRLPNPERDSDK